MSDQLISLKFSVDGQDVANIQRLRSDLTSWTETQMMVDTSNNAGFGTTSFSPASTTMPALIFQNNGIVPVLLSVKATHGGSLLVFTIPAADFLYLPQVDYTITFLAATSSNTALCTAWVGYS